MSLFDSIYNLVSFFVLMLKRVSSSWVGKFTILLLTLVIVILFALHGMKMLSTDDYVLNKAAKSDAQSSIQGVIDDAEDNDSVSDDLAESVEEDSKSLATDKEDVAESADLGVDDDIDDGSEIDDDQDPEDNV